ncbi:MAG TPA: DUF2231 domain-containing protein [Candidatus Solibacter sp.]|nr:DUF2231 domain-containing protein [Candidatus Solibacter sp.]
MTGATLIRFEVFHMALLAWVRPNPFDIRTVIFTKHAQHVVLIHFPIALFITAVAFDLIAYWTRRRTFADAAYYNLLVAALATVPVVATGIIAWQLQLEGQKLKGNLLLHLLLGSLSAALICLVWWLHFRPRRKMEDPPTYRFLIEAIAVLVVMATGHLGGFLSGVNVPS